MSKVIFCREGVIAGFYRTLANLNKELAIDIAAYGASPNALLYPKFYLANKHSSVYAKETVEVFLFYDRQNTMFNQISAEDWKEIGINLDGISDRIKVEHIEHIDSIEDWFFDDCQGLSKFFGMNIKPPGTSGREYIKACCYNTGRPYVNANESEGKSLVAALNIPKIAQIRGHELSSLLNP